MSKVVSGSRIPTNQRALLILEVIGRSDRSMTPTEINAELGLPKQSIHRLCTTLVEEGFLIPEPKGRRLRPTRRLRLMATGIMHASSFHIARHQVMLDVARKIQETINFVAPEDGGMTYLDRVETDWPFRIQLPVGTHVPFHCTASGKTFLASLAAAARKSMVQCLQLEQHTPNTLTDPTALLQELKKISKQGYAVDNEEFMEGMVAVAVPINDETGRYVASLAFHAPIQRISLENAVSKTTVLIDAAKMLRDVLFI